jgi:integrase
MGMLGTTLEYARNSLKLIKENPARGLKKPPDRKQQRFLSFGEIARLGHALRESERQGESPVALAAIRLLLLTGLRRMEALSLRQLIVDDEAGCIRFDDTKSGPQIRPIGAEAVRVIQEQRSRNGCHWVFPASHGDGHFVGLPKVLERICARAGLEGVTIHVLRHSFAASAAHMGFSELTIAGLLGHSVPGITARYAHVPDSALVAAADQVSGRLASALDSIGSAEQTPRAERFV